MTKCILSLISVLIILTGSSAVAAEWRPQVVNPRSIIEGGSADAAKTAVDTLLLIGPHGSGAQHNGQFESTNGSPNWQGWTSSDLTKNDDHFWHISTYHAAGLNGHGEGNRALWCGSMDFPACDDSDEDGGYGNEWNQIIDWYGTVADNSLPCSVTLEAWISYDLEPGYDYLLLKAVLSDGEFVFLQEADGTAVNEHWETQITYSPNDFGGENSDQVHLQFVVDSDEIWSDQDCLFTSVGACQVDDIRVTMDNGSINSFSEFEDGTMGDWNLGDAPFVGDFAKLWMSLEDVDPCQNNSSSQVAFVDDGVVVPGTGGTYCEDWCYGPGGYVVNSTGGLAGDDYHLNNIIISPNIDISALTSSGYQLEYDMYSHELYNVDSPGIFVRHLIRSTASDDPADIEDAPWVSGLYLFILPGEYNRQTWNLSTLVVPNAKHLQVAMGVLEFGYNWGYDGNNATPGPYFDNVRLTSFDAGGPYLRVFKANLAQDGFPGNGYLDWDNPAANSVRFDMARAEDSGGNPLSAPGDSIVCNVTPLREDAVLYGEPLLHYRLKANPAFDAYRSSGLPNVGSVDGWNILDQNGYPISNRYAFDLPDEGFLYPGDVLHYFIAATDDLFGDQKTSTLPADTTGFSMMESPLDYDPVFTVRALPDAIGFSGSIYQRNEILFWNDGGNIGRKEWYSAMANSGLIIGEDVDEFYTTDAWNSLGNGLGFRATLEQLSGYSMILYTSGATNFKPLNESDALLIDQWLALGDKNLLATGDNLLSGLEFGSDIGRQMLEEDFGVQYIGNLTPYINNQNSPLVVPVGIWSYFDEAPWVAHGGCPQVSAFDAVVALDHATRMASFTNPAGNPTYAFSAMTYCENGSKVLSLPYRLDAIINDINSGGNPLNMSARSLVFRYVLDVFGFWGYFPADTPEAITLKVANYPNPFNPSTTIAYVLPNAEHLSVKVYDLRGKLVSTLVDEDRAAGPGQVVWSGTNDQGAEVSSGVYFYKLKAGEEVRIQKMSLVK